MCQTLVVVHTSVSYHNGNGLYFYAEKVEIAWMLFDDEENCIESKQYLLKPQGYDEIDRMATRDSHGITTELANKLGSDANSVLSEFTTILKNLPQDGFVIAHGMKRENAIFENSLNSEQLVVWKAASKV